MLEKLNEVNWKKLSHAYGSAEDVPDLLRALASEDGEKREKAYYALYGNVFHQGTRWEASPHVIPFLYELLADEKTPDKAELIEYILHLAVGYPEEWLPLGVDVKVWQQNNDDAYFQYAKDCYFNAAQGEDILLSCTYSDEAAVRMNAVWALSYFAALLSEKTVQRIKEINYQIDYSDAERAGSLLALGLIDYHKQSAAHLPLLMTAFTSEHLFIKVAAAISVLVSAGFAANHPKAMYLAMLPLEDGESLSGQSPFFEGNMQGYIAEVLALADNEDAELLLPSLTRMLEGIKPMQSLVVTDASLTLVRKAAPDLDPPYPSPSAFSPAAQEALRNIGRHGGWKMGEGTFANY